MANLTIYRTYPFNSQTGQDPILEEVREALQKEGLDTKKGVVKELSGVSTQTLYNWFSGKTKSPRYSTIAAVYGALGFEPVFRRQSKFDLDAEMKDAKAWNMKQKANKLAADRRKAMKKKSGAKPELRAST